MKKAILIFAHGARDPEWARPFEHLRDEVATRSPGTEVVVNLSGRGDKDVNTVADRLGGALGG